MQYLLLVGLGGALGAVARHGVTHLVRIQFGSSLLGTFLANVSGSFILGLLVGLLSSHPTWPAETRLNVSTTAVLNFVAVGFLGSYTTFSTLSVATIQSLQKGDVSTAGINLGASVLLGLTAAVAGLMLGRAI